jgi:hypothetical protein
MIGHKLPNKTKSATVAELKLFHQLNNPYGGWGCEGASHKVVGEAAWAVLVVGGADLKERDDG